MEEKLKEDEEMRTKLGLPAPQRWKQYAKSYLQGRSHSIYNHLKNHIFLTIKSLRDKIIMRQQRQRDKIERPEMFAKKNAKKSEKWQEKRMLQAYKYVSLLNHHTL